MPEELVLAEVLQVIVSYGMGSCQTTLDLGYCKPCRGLLVVRNERPTGERNPSVLSCE